MQMFNVFRFLVVNTRICFRYLFDVWNLINEQIKYNSGDVNVTFNYCTIHPILYPCANIGAIKNIKRAIDTDRN